MANACS
jgi:hypothetical protein